MRGEFSLLTSMPNSEYLTSERVECLITSERVEYATSAPSLSLYVQGGGLENKLLVPAGPRGVRSRGDSGRELRGLANIWDIIHLTKNGHFTIMWCPSPGPQLEMISFPPCNVVLSRLNQMQRAEWPQNDLIKGLTACCLQPKNAVILWTVFT